MKNIKYISIHTRKNLNKYTYIHDTQNRLLSHISDLCHRIQKNYIFKKFCIYEAIIQALIQIVKIEWHTSIYCKCVAEAKPLTKCAA